MNAPDRAVHWRTVRRVLAVRLDNLGDVLMTTPALAALRQGLPHAHITLLTSPGAALAAPHLPMLDAVWPCAVPWTQGAAQQTGSLAELGRAEATLVDRLADAHFDAAVIFTVCTQSPLPAALLCRMAGIPLRLAHCRENPYGLLSDWVPETDQVLQGTPQPVQQTMARHEVTRQLALVASVGMHTANVRLRFAVHPEDRVTVAQRLRDAGLPPGSPYAVLHPGASAASRRWPAQRFGAVAEAIGAAGCTAVFAGNGAEVALATQALQAMPPTAAAAALSVAGQLSLGELAALIEGAQVLVANNSAPAHLAAAVGTPVVNLYALTNPQHTPWQVPLRVLNHDVSCRWCLKSTCPQVHHDCLRRVETDAVAAAALDLMQVRNALDDVLPRTAAREAHG